MITKTFVEDQQEVQVLLSSLVSTSEKSGYYSEILINPESGEKWEKYIFELDIDDAIGLRKYPYPSIEETVEIALTSEFEDEVEGAAAYLIEYEKEREFRELLIERLEENIGQLSLNRFEILCDRAELNDKTNRCDCTGKHYSEINKDYEYFVSLVDRVEAIRKILEEKH